MAVIVGAVTVGALLAAGVLAGTASADHAPGWASSDALIANDSDGVAEAVAVDGDTLVVGAPATDVSYNVQGVALIYERGDDGWERTDRLTAANTGQFGAAVAVDGDTVAVGDPDGGNPGAEHPEPGAVFVYERDGDAWTQTDRLTTNGTEELGTSVAVDEDRIVAGDVDAGEPAEAGAVLVFARSWDTWQKTDRLVAPYTHELGTSVDVDGDTIVAGDVDAGAASDAGAAVVFERPGFTWTRTARLTATNAQNMGAAVAVDGDTVVVGDPDGANPDGGPGAGQGASVGVGAALVYERAGGGWTETARLGADATRNLGAALALDGDLLAVGAPDAGAEDGGGLPGAPGDGEEDRSGAVLVYERTGDGWPQDARVQREDARRMGATVSLDAPTLAAGDREAPPTGVGHVLERDLDRDGLEDRAEPGVGTAPATADTDGDGLEDGPEALEHPSDPLDPDTDDDGLQDGPELDHGADPRDADTDGDLYRDGTEVARDSSPTDPVSVPTPVAPTPYTPVTEGTENRATGGLGPMGPLVAVTEEGTVVVYDDRDGDGGYDEGEAYAETPVPDGDGDRAPDALEPIVCEARAAGAPLPGACADGDYTPPGAPTPPT